MGEVSRPVFSFRPNLEHPDHKKAWEILQGIPEGQKNRFLVDAILKGAEAAYLEKVIRKTVREELKGGSVTQSVGQEMQEPPNEEIPSQMLDFLSQIEDCM